MDGKVNNCGSNIDFGMGVRVLAGDQSGYAYVEGVTLEEMLRASAHCRPALHPRARRQTGRADGEDNSPKPLCCDLSLGRCERKREDSLSGKTE